MKRIVFVIITLVLISVMTETVKGQQRRPGNPALDSLRNEKDPVTLQKKLDQLGKGQETDLNLLLRYYGITGNEAKADSVLQVVVKRFPNGSQAFVQFQNKLFVARGGKTQEEIFIANKDKFPDANLDQAYYSVSNAYASEGNVAKMKVYGAMIKEPNFRSAAIRLNGRSLMTKDLPAAEAYIRPEVEALLAKGIPPEPGADQSRGLDERRASYMEFMDLYASILIKNGKYSEALKYSKEAYEKAKNKNDQLKSNYAFLLSKNGQHEEAMPLLRGIVESGKGSADIKQALKESYSRLNPGKDAGAFMTGLEQGMKSKIEEEVAKMLVNETAPNFVVKDASGKIVSLADFAGKTIVLDFWATWCGPCKASFPAMQMAVNKYSNDPKVKFLFIHTWEKVEDPLTDAKTYLNSNHYKMDLYMDTKDPKTKTNPAVTAFGVKGIPAKFVIDGAGKIRFKMMGFAGGDDAAVAELSAMIEMTKKGV